MENVVSACRTLFGTPFFISQSIVNWLQPQDVAIAFQKTVEKHIPPGIDILKDGGKLHVPTLRCYIQAYKALIEHIEKRENEGGMAAAVVLNHSHGQRRLRFNGGSGVSHGENSIDTMPLSRRMQGANELYYEGNMPPTKLRFGAYLYYRGLISYQMLTDAIEWQKKRRPLMGQIAMKCGLLSPADFAQILFYLRVGESFGKVALEHGKMSETNIRKIACHQQKFNSKIGSFFAETGILPENLVERCYGQFEMHNELYGQ